MKKLLCLSFALFFGGCISLNEASRRYFYLEKPMAGVESPEKVVEKFTAHPAMTRLLYGDIKDAELIQCLLLRNQLYVAAQSDLSGADRQKIKAIVEMVERAFQESDKAFFSACERAMKEAVLSPFEEAQQEFINS